MFKIVNTHIKHLCNQWLFGTECCWSILSISVWSQINPFQIKVIPGRDPAHQVALQLPHATEGWEWGIEVRRCCMMLTFWQSYNFWKSFVQHLKVVPWQLYTLIWQFLEEVQELMVPYLWLLMFQQINGSVSVFSQYWTLGILLIVKVPVPLSTTFQSWCHAQILVELFHLAWILKGVFCWSSGVVMIVSTLGHRFS